MFNQENYSVKVLMFFVIVGSNLFAAATFAQSHLSGGPIWIYDGDLYAQHIATADLNGDLIPDVVAAEYSNNYYGYPSKVWAINGESGDTLWSYTVDDGIRSMALGDINGDGVPDVIAGASYHGSNTPDGRIHAINGESGALLWTYSTGSTNQAVAVGNFNGDMYLDVAVASFDDYVYAINGETGGLLWSRLIGSIFVNDVSVGDVNGDNIDDVCYAHEYLAGWDNYQGVLDGTDGSTIWSLTVPYVVLETLIEDIDNDGLPEAIITGIYPDDHGEIFVRDALTGTLEWSYNFGSINHVNGKISPYAFDIDEDSDLDLVIGNHLGSYQIIAFNGDSNTPMMISDTLDGFPKKLAFGDVTGDGELNIVAACWDRVQVVSAKDGVKTWYYAIGGVVASVATGDFDNNGITDVAAAGGADYTGIPPNPGKSVWALKTVDSPFLWETSFGQYGNAVAVDDLDGDGKADVVSVSSLDDKVMAMSGVDGSELWNWVGTQNLYAVTTGDFDGSLLPDVAVAGNDDMVTALDGTDGELLWQFPVGDQVYRKCLHAADLNGDNRADVIVGSDDNNLYAINGVTGLELWSVTFPADIEDIELAQMDGSGPLDIVVANSGSSAKMTVLDGSDGGVLWDYISGSSATKHVEVMDANGDGTLDVAIGISGAGRVIMVDGITHTPLWTADPLAITYEYGLAHGDFNGDGSDDLVVGGNSSDKSVRVLDGNTGAEMWNYLTAGEVNVVKVIDVTGDGLPDVIAGSDDQSLYILNGDKGTSLFDVSLAGDVMSIDLGDINGDGVPNIACVTFGSSGVAYAVASFYEAGCCVGIRGNADGDAGDEINISDLTFLVAFLFSGGNEPLCAEEGDIDGSGGSPAINISDITYLVAYMFSGGPPPPDCP